MEHTLAESVHIMSANGNLPPPHWFAHGGAVREGLLERTDVNARSIRAGRLGRRLKASLLSTSTFRICLSSQRETRLSLPITRHSLRRHHRSR
jgi:hypothetical protein